MCALAAASAVPTGKEGKETLPAALSTRLAELKRQLDEGNPMRISMAAVRLSSLRARISGIRLRLSATMSVGQTGASGGERVRMEEARRRIVLNYNEMERLLVLIGARRESPAELRALADDLQRLLAEEDGRRTPAPSEHGRGTAPQPWKQNRSNGQ